MTRRGPRGDISADIILDAALKLLTEQGSIQAVSLRMVAREVGVAPNAIYTYFTSINHLWAQAKERELARVQPASYGAIDCHRCALKRLLSTVNGIPATPLLDLHQQYRYIGPGSFRFAERVCELVRPSHLPMHSARNIIFTWVVGRSSLRRQDALDPWHREEMLAAIKGADFPLEHAANLESMQSMNDDDREVEVILDAVGLFHEHCELATANA